MSDEDEDSSREESTKNYCPSVKCQNSGMLQDKIDELEKMLARTRQHLKSKENLIGIQAEQLKKLEEMYKSTLDENQSVNYKSKKASQDLDNLKLVIKSHETAASNQSNNEFLMKLDLSKLNNRLIFSLYNNSVLLQNMQDMLKMQQSALGAIFALCYYIAWRQHESSTKLPKVTSESVEKIEKYRTAERLPPSSQNNDTVDMLIAEINDLRSQVSKYKSCLREAIYNVCEDSERIAEMIRMRSKSKLPTTTGENFDSKKMKITVTVPMKKIMQGHRANPSSETPQVTAIKMYDKLSDETVSSSPIGTSYESEKKVDEFEMDGIDFNGQQTETMPGADYVVSEIPKDRLLIESSFTSTSNEMDVHNYQSLELFNVRGADAQPENDEPDKKTSSSRAKESPNPSKDVEVVCTKAITCNESALRDLRTEIHELKNGFVALKDQLQQEADDEDLASSIRELQEEVKASDKNLRHALVAYQGDNDEINSLKNVCVKLLTDIPQFLACTSIVSANTLTENLRILNDEVVEALGEKPLEKACVKHIQNFNDICPVPITNLPESLVTQSEFLKTIMNGYRKQIDDLKSIHEPEVIRLNSVIQKLTNDLIKASNQEEDLQEQLEKHLAELYELQQSEKNHNDAIDQLEEKLLQAEQRCFKVDEALEKIKINCTTSETVSEYCEKCVELLDTINSFKTKYQYLETNCQTLENQVRSVNELKNKMNVLNDNLKQSENENVILQERLHNINRQMNKMVVESNQQDIIEELDRRLKKATQEKKALAEKLTEHHKAMEDYKARLNGAVCECEKYKNKLKRTSVEQMSLTDVLQTILEAADSTERNTSLQEFIISNEEDIRDILKANLVAQEILHDAPISTTENTSPAFLSLQRNIQLLLDNLKEKQKRDNV